MVNDDDGVWMSSTGGDDEDDRDAITAGLSPRSDLRVRWAVKGVLYKVVGVIFRNAADETRHATFIPTQYMIDLVTSACSLGPAGESASCA